MRRAATAALTLALALAAAGCGPGEPTEKKKNDDLPDPKGRFDKPAPGGGRGAKPG